MRVPPHGQQYDGALTKIAQCIMQSKHLLNIYGYNKNMKVLSTLFAFVIILAIFSDPSNVSISDASANDAPTSKSISKQKKLEDKLTKKYKDFDAIWGNTRRISKEDLKKYMISTLAKNPKCKPELVDISTQRKNSYYLLCTDLNKIYWTVDDMKNAVVRSAPKHLSDTTAIKRCEDLIRKELANSRTFKRKYFDTGVSKVLQGRSEVVIGFSAKNGLGMKVDFRARCLVGNDVGEIQSLVQV